METHHNSYTKFRHRQGLEDPKPSGGITIRVVIVGSSLLFLPPLYNSSDISGHLSRQKF